MTFETTTALSTSPVSGTRRAVDADRRQAPELATHLTLLIKSLVIRRAFEKQARSQSDFWHVTLGGLTNTAVLEWCKLFGPGRGDGITGWAADAAGRETVEHRLLAHLGITADEWAAFRAGMFACRDRIVTGLDEGAPASPDLDLALKSAFFLRETMRAHLDRHLPGRSATAVATLRGRHTGRAVRAA